MTKRGRKGKVGPRFPSGKLREAKIGPTPELEAKRALIATSPDPKANHNRNGDATLSTCPLDALLARGFITEQQHQAGESYARLYRIVNGKGMPKVMDSGGPGGEISEAVLIRAKETYLLAASALLAVSRRVKDAVDNATVFERWPNSLTGVKPRPSDRHLFEGLGRLASLLLDGNRRAA